jgi:aminoglycoside/choline kinase family phosphotransferase
MKPEMPMAPDTHWPDGLSEITPGELLQAFRANLDLEIRSVRISSMQGDASTRRYYRAALAGGKVSSAILMVLPESCSPDVSELPFLNIRAFLASLGLPVPEFYFALPSNGVIVLEDFGDEVLEAGLEKASPSQAESWYRNALDSLVTMQSNRGDSHAFTYAFTAAKFEEELLFFLEHAVEGLWGQRLPPDHRSALIEEFRSLCEALVSPGSGDPVFTHRDYHSRNLMILKDRSRLGILDFQDARLGPRAYDLASLVFDSYVTLPPDFRDRLVGYYLSCWEKVSGTKMDREAFGQSLRLAATQRNLKAVGTFAYQGYIMGKKRYLDSIGPTLTYVQDHCQLLPELSGLWELLVPILPGAGDSTRLASGRTLPCFDSSV